MFNSLQYYFIFVDKIVFKKKESFVIQYYKTIYEIHEIPWTILVVIFEMEIYDVMYILFQ